MAQLYRLKLKSLSFVSSVDTPAQETAVARLIKRKGGEQHIAATARVAKISNELGLVFGWALTTKADGADYFDLHGDNITEDDLIKIAADWMSAGGAADTMHDREQDGRAVFCMPMTTEVAKAVYGDKIGGELGTYGLLVAIRPSAEDFAKFKSGELTGFSIDGTGFREPVRARKSADARYLTDEVQGHQHEVCVYDGGDPWMTDATAAGAMSPHRHTVTRAQDGSLTVLADSGHTHTLTESPRVIVIDEGTVAVPEAVAARAPVGSAPRTAGDSPRSQKSQNVKSVTKENTVDPTQELAQLKDLNTKLQARIAELEQQAAAATTQASLTDGEKAHLATMTAPEQKRFLALEKSARLAEVEKANEVVHTCIDGTVIRKSDGPTALKFAKLADDALRTAQAEKSARETVELTKRAESTIGKLAGKTAVHVALLKAAESIEGEIEVDGKKLKLADEAVKTLKAANDAMAERAKAPGFGSAVDADPADPTAKLDAMTLEYAQKNNVDRPAARVAVMKTAEGRRLYAESVGRA